MSHMVSLDNEMGAHSSRNGSHERDEIKVKLQEIEHDVEMAQFTSLAPSTCNSSFFNSSTDSVSAASMQPWHHAGCVSTLPDKNSEFCGSDDVYMKRLKSCIANIHIDAAASSRKDCIDKNEKGKEQSEIPPSNSDVVTPRCTPEYIAVLGADSGLGKSELVREYCQQLTASDATLIGWITASDEASLLLSFRELAMAIKSAHPSFCPTQSIATLNKDGLFKAVTLWIGSLTDPWILVVDNLDSEDILITQSFLPCISSSASPCTIIITSRLLDLPIRWEALMEKKSLDIMAKNDYKVASTIPAVLSFSHKTLTQEIHAMSLSKIGAIHIFPMSAENAYELATIIFDEEIDAGSRWNRDGQSLVKKICGRLNFCPLAIRQAFACIKSVHQHRQSTKSGNRYSALGRALGLLAFISTSAFDIRMISSWLLPPNTPYLVRIQKKWRVPNSDKLKTSKCDIYSQAEFEILVESVYPVETTGGRRFSWRVFRTFDRIRDCINAVNKTYSSEISSLLTPMPMFPCRQLPVSGPDDVMEEAVARRRVELQSFFDKFLTCKLWGRICTCDSMKDLLGITSTKTPGGGESNLANERPHIFQPYHILNASDSQALAKCPANVDENFVKLASPLFSLGFISVFKRRDIHYQLNEIRSWLLCCISRDMQSTIQSWLKAEGRYDDVQADVVRYLNASFRFAYNMYKKGSDIFSVKSSKKANSKDDQLLDTVHGALSCEQLLPHVLSTLSAGVSVCHDECFELSSLTYFFCSAEGLFTEALFCATFCVEIVTQREGSVDSVDDGVWHSHLADVLCMLKRGDEANSMYEHSLLVLRKRCGQYDKQTFTVLAKFGRSLFEQGKYKHAIKIMEEALMVCRYISTKSNGAGISNKLLGSFSPTSSQSLSTITSLPVADQIEELVEVLLANAPDSKTVKRCLELKREQLSILRRAHGEYSIQVARCLNSIGQLERKDHSKKGREYFEDCLDVLVRCVGGESHELISPLHNLAMLEHAAHNFTEAKKLYQRAIEISQKRSVNNDVSAESKLDSAMMASIHDSIGMLYGDEGDHEKALFHLEKGYKMYCELYGSDNHEVAVSLSNLARAWLNMNDSDQAKSLYSKSLKTLRKLGGRADEDVIARNLNALGEIYMNNKEYDEARQLFMECLSARVNLYGERHVDSVAAMKNLSVLAYLTGSYDEAHTICYTARAIQIDIDGTDATVQAAALTGHLAEISRVLGKISDAEVFYKDAVALYRKIYGDNHPSVSLQLNNMASMLFSCNRYSEAEILYESSRDMLIKCYGKDHDSVATALVNIAKLNEAAGKYDKAMALHSESLGILLKLHGSENKIVADALMDIGELLLVKRDLNEAVDACSQALGIRTRLYGDSCNHTEIVDSLYLMGRIRLKNGDAVEAMKLFEDALRMQVVVEKDRRKKDAHISSERSSESIIKVVNNIEGNTSSLKTAHIIEDMCSLLHGKDNMEEKMLLYEKVLQIKRAILGEEDESVADSLAVLGDILFQRKMYSESIEVLRVARAVKVKIRTENHPSSILSLNRIAKCLRALGRLDEARSMLEQCVINTRRLYGDNNFSTSVALFELARMLQLVEEYDTAITMAEQALQIRIEVEKGLNGNPCPSYGSISPHYYLGQLHQLLGELCKALNDAENAKVHFLKSYNINKECLNSFESDDGINAMYGLAWASAEQGNFDEAISMRDKIASITSTVYKAKDETFVQELNDMGKVLRARGNYTEALNCYTKAKIAAEVIHGRFHPNTLDSCEGLAWLLEKLGKTMEASEMSSEITTIRKALGDDDDGKGEGLGAVLQSGAASLFGKLSMLMSEKTE